jgi:hypothetical protein
MKLKAIFFAGLSITTLSFTASPLPASASVNQTDLEKDGYTCSYDRTGFGDICTKPGGRTYSCSSVCIAHPTTIQAPNNDPKGKFPKFPGKGGLKFETGK